jgi:amidohydrolase
MIKFKSKILVIGLLCFSAICFSSDSLVWLEEKPQVIPPETRKIRSIREEFNAEVDKIEARLIEINDWMYHNPEPGFLEFKASQMLIDELKKHGFIVETGVPGLDEEFDRLKIVGGLSPDYDGPPGIPTAFKAKYKGNSVSPVIGIAVEYDALRGNPPFHGCQHNMQGPTGIGAAIALAKIMDKHSIPGSVWIIGTPAEEVGPPAKAIMAKTGYFDGIDFMFRSHGVSRGTARYPGGFTARHIRQMKYTFHGKSAHAQSPWQGRSALDAVLLLFHSVDMIREHSEPQFRFHGIVSDGGAAPNIVPALASATIWIRHIMDETTLGMSPKRALEKIEKKVAELDDMAKAAALATGTKVDLDHYGEYDPGIAVGALNDVVFQYAVDYGGINIGERKLPRHWEETGFGTLVVPGAHALIMTAKVMGASALRLLMDPDLCKKAKEEHAMWVEKYKK